MTIKNFAKNAAFTAGMFVFPIKAKTPTTEYDIDAHIAAIQASFRNAVKYDLKPIV